MSVLMGRQTAKLMGYVKYPQLKPPTRFSIQSDETVVKAARVSSQSQPKAFGTRTSANINTYQCQTDHSASEGQNKIGMQTNVNFIKPLAKTVSEVTPVTLQCRNISKHPQKPEVHWYNSKITLNGKEHSLPTTKEYMLKEYADIFSGTGTLPGMAYHIELKDNYKPVQHAPCTVPAGMQDAYNAELQRLLHKGVIVEVHNYTEWVNSIVPVQKPNGEIRLCLDPRHLNMAIKHNPWYMRTLDDILPKISNAKTISMSNATSGYWHILLDYASSLSYHIQYTLGQIQMAETTIWTENSI